MDTSLKLLLSRAGLAVRMRRARCRRLMASPHTMVIFQSCDIVSRSGLPDFVQASCSVQRRIVIQS